MIGLKLFRDVAAGWVRTIRKDDGYLTDAGQNVITDRPGDDGATRKTIVGVYVTDVLPTNVTPMRIDWSFQITIEARVPTSMDNSEDVTIDILEDLLKAVPTHYSDAPQNLKKLVVEGTVFDRQPDGVPFNVAGITLRGSSFENRDLPN